MDRKIWTFNERNTVTAYSGPKIKAAYLRVSTKKQKLTRQFDDIKAACPDAVFFSEVYTGTKSDRPEWQKLLKMCRQGQVSEIWFCDVSRMSRNKQDGYMTWKLLYDMEIELHFLQTPQVDTTTYKEAVKKMINIEPSFEDAATNALVSSILSSINDYMISLAKRQIYIAFDEAEQEAKHLSQRTSEGMAVARIKGKNIGRREGITIQTWKRQKSVQKIKKHYEKYGGDLSAADCIKMFNISKTTFYKYLEQIDREMAGEEVTFTYNSRKKHTPKEEANKCK